jgi:hypothetical protein
MAGNVHPDKSHLGYLNQLLNCLWHTSSIIYKAVAEVIQFIASMFASSQTAGSDRFRPLIFAHAIDRLSLFDSVFLPDELNYQNSNKLHADVMQQTTNRKFGSRLYTGSTHLCNH